MKKVLKRRGRLIQAVLGAILSGVLLSCGPLFADKPANNPSTGSATYSGRAVALRIDGTTNPPGPIIYADTGPLPTTGGALTASQSDINVANGALTVDVADAEVTGRG